jgi:hypothetical protein
MISCCIRARNLRDPKNVLVNSFKGSLQKYMDKQTAVQNRISTTGVNIYGKYGIASSPKLCGVVVGFGLEFRKFCHSNGLIVVEGPMYSGNPGGTRPNHSSIFGAINGGQSRTPGSV